MQRRVEIVTKHYDDLLNRVESKTESTWFVEGNWSYKLSKQIFPGNWKTQWSEMKEGCDSKQGERFWTLQIIKKKKRWKTKNLISLTLFISRRVCWVCCPAQLVQNISDFCLRGAHVLFLIAYWMTQVRMKVIQDGFISKPSFLGFNTVAL